MPFNSKTKTSPDLPKIRIEDYSSWSFRDRSFALALALSVAWHLFWFFSITIVVNTPRKPEKVKPRLVSLGPVLDDTMFRTLVQSRPAFSQTFYKNNTDLTPPMEMPAVPAQPHQPGDVVSVPLSRRIFDSLRGILSGSKPVSEFAPGRAVPDGFYEETVVIEGALKNRAVLSKPDIAWVMGQRDPQASGDLALAPLEFDIEVDREGVVETAAEVSAGAGRLAESVWSRYLRQWRFTASEDPLAGLEKGRVRLTLRPAAGRRS